MIKVDRVNDVSTLAAITKVKAEVDAIFDAMRLSMQRGERIELRGFGVFQVRPRKRGVGRNPRTGQEVPIPPGRTIRFRPGKDLQNLGSLSITGVRNSSTIPGRSILRLACVLLGRRRCTWVCADRAWSGVARVDEGVSDGCADSSLPRTRNDVSRYTPSQ